MVARKALREDLCGQLEVLPLRVPSLAERVEDIVPLILHFTAELDEGAGLTWGEAALNKMVARHHPRNVRELRNKVERAVTLALDSGRVELAHLDFLNRETRVVALPACAGRPETFDFSGHTLETMEAESRPRGRRFAGPRVTAAMLVA